MEISLENLYVDIGTQRVKQGKQRVSKTGRILSENGRPQIFIKNRRFLPVNLC